MNISPIANSLLNNATLKYELLGMAIINHIYFLPLVHVKDIRETEVLIQNSKIPVLIFVAIIVEYISKLIHDCHNAQGYTS